MSRFAAVKDSLRCCGPKGVVSEGLPQEYFPPQWRRKLRRGGPESMGTVFFLSTFKIHQDIKNN